MSIVLIFENKDPKPWEQLLKEKITDTPIEIYPNVKDNSAVEFVICWKPKKNVLAQFPNIKVIQSVGASIDHITNSQQIHEDIIVTRIVDYHLSNDMWEFLLASVLNQLKNFPLYAEHQKLKTWEQRAYKSIKNTTVSILGLGQIGSFVAERFTNIGFEVRGWSTSKKEIQNVKSFAGNEALDTFLKKSDILINLLPLTKETEGILNIKTLQKLPKGAFLINVGRGEHLIEEDLIQLLDNSHLSGALLDVFREEPLPKNHAYWKHPKIIITPHVASLTNVESAAKQIIENYKRFTNNQKLKHIVSIKKGY